MHGAASGRFDPENVMTLQSELLGTTLDFRAELDAEQRRHFDRAIVYLRFSGLASGALRTGEYVPEFELESTAGGRYGLSDLVRGGPSVVTFYWGGWNRCCMHYLRALQDRLGEFEAAGARVVGISCEAMRDLRATARLNRLAFDLLSDERGRVARLFGLQFQLPEELYEIFQRLGVDIAAFTTTPDLALPVPATYVVNGDGAVTYASVDPDPTRRPDPSVVLGEVQRLTGGSPLAIR
jgi:peroxiredoxin